jgi:hypothetical protein
MKVCGRYLRGFLFVCLATALAQPLANAADFGAITGIVRDARQAPIAGATITAVKSDGGTVRSTISNSDGVYSFSDVVPGTWAITVQTEGQPDFTSPALSVVAGRGARADLSTAFAVAPSPAMAIPGTAAIASAAPAGPSGPAADPPRNTWADPAANPPRNTSSANQPSTSVWKRWLRGEPILWSDMETKKPQPVLLASTSTNTVPASAPSSASPTFPVADPPAGQPVVAPPAQHKLPEALEAPDPSPSPDNFTPFAFGDFTWLNGTPRNKDTVLDTKFFTPEVRFDTHFMEDFNQPIDHSMGGATESFRSGEFQLEQASVGGDFHWDNVRGRILTMDGLFATTTPRNDPSAGVGQWDVRGAYKYVSEAYGGYHWDVNHGLNVDAGIFVSYIGLFSYYNFDNWTYQPSFVSSNTPWFFNGLRIQWFPTNKLKIEPWIINGWQSYNRTNGHHGFGGQILYRPTENVSMVFNNYGNGTDTLGNPNRVRIHTDDSLEYRYYNSPGNLGVSKMAFSLTGDLGCEYGKDSGVSCTGKGGQPKQAFLGWMAYNRIWFHRDLLALTTGGGMMNNPGRYLTLLPPINGADAISGSPYFTENPGDKSHMWDSSVNLQYMPKQYITWWAEAVYRHSDVPYWTGRGGITPPGGNNGSPTQYACMSGAPSGATDLATAQINCGGASNVWFPDLRRGQMTFSVGVMVKF